MSSNMTSNLYPRALEMSSDKKFLLIKRSSHSVFRRSSFGIYSILQLRPNGQHMKKSFELKPSGFVPTSPNEEQSHFHIRYVKWAPTGNGLVYVDYQNNIYYRKTALARFVSHNTIPQRVISYISVVFSSRYFHILLLLLTGMYNLPTMEYQEFFITEFLTGYLKRKCLRTILQFGGHQMPQNW